MEINISELKTPHKKDRDTKNNKALKESIMELGLIEPIVINDRNEIISGRRRFFAAKELQLHKVSVVYTNSNSLDQEIACIDANLMTMPLGEVDHDLALAKRKKLYEQKYPESRQFASRKGEAVAFTKDVSEIIGTTRRSVEHAIARAEKASHMVNTARRGGTISATVTNATIKII